MPIVGFNFTKMHVERNGRLDPKDKIANAVNLINIGEEKMPFSEGKGLLRMDFQFDITYGKVGKMALNGSILYLDDPKKNKRDIRRMGKRQKTRSKAFNRNF